MADATGVEVAAAADPESAVREADIVCCATTSREPVFEAAWLRPGTHVNGIGAFNLGMVELPPELFGIASVVAVDAREAALAEAGDVVAGDRARIRRHARISWRSAASTARGPPRAIPTAITVFKSVGLAIQDVAAAELIAARLLDRSSEG